MEPLDYNAPAARLHPITRATSQTGYVRLEDHPEYIRVCGLLMDALKPYPEARQAVVRAFEAAEEAQKMSK